ncbi:MAG: hypothetical protein WKF84_25430 [Pyrinomonadaceae bacterium]
MHRVLTRSLPVNLREQVARHGLAARHQNIEVLSLAKDVIELAAIGLRRINPQELHYLDILHEMVIDNGVSPSDILLRNWRWLLARFDGSSLRIHAGFLTTLCHL